MNALIASRIGQKLVMPTAAAGLCLFWLGVGFTTLHLA